MFKCVTVFVFAYILQINAFRLLGPGIWSLISVTQCPEKIEDSIISYEYTRHKVNRTHDGITGYANVYEDLGDHLGGRVELCKYVDGGCKPYTTLAEDNVVKMLMRYGKEENIIKALEISHIDPPEFPIRKGEYHTENFMVDYCSLPRDGIYGRFEAKGFFMKGSKKVSCMKIALEFNEFDDENFCDE